MSLYLRGRIFWIKIAGAGKATIRESTGTAVRREAQEYHDKRVAELWRVRALGERPQVGLFDAIGGWLVEHAINKRSYEDDRLRVRTMLEVLPDIPTDRVTTAVLTRLHRDIMKMRGCSSTTANRYLELISAVLHYERRQDRLQYVPAIPYAKETPATPPFLTPEEAKRLIDELPIHLSRMARFALATGLRESNVRMLEWPQVDLPRSCAWIHGENAKAGKSIAVPLSEDALSVLADCRGGHAQRVFTYQRRPIARKVYNHAFLKARVRAGVPWLRWHDLRHTWASWHIMRGTPPEVLQKLGGWSTLAMVMRYAHLAPSYTAQWVENSRMGTVEGTAKQLIVSEAE